MRKASPAPDVSVLAEEVHSGDRVALSRAITLVESTRAEHREQAQHLLNRMLPHPDAPESLRVGVTGVPGVGKSTFIEALGTRLAEEGRRLAVLAVDPTSTRSKGAILGDKTRMERLAAHENAFVRPSPTGGTLGGVARKTREAITLCEAAGYDTIFVETVGVGQAEIAVHSMVDAVLLLAPVEGGDALQGIKRGVLEVADALVITKADGTNEAPAEAARARYTQALRLFPKEASGWEPPVLTCSAHTGKGLDTVWETVQRYEEWMRADGFFDERRRRQALHAVYRTIEHRLHEAFFSDEGVQHALAHVEADVQSGRLSSFSAAEKLLAARKRTKPPR